MGQGAVVVATGEIDLTTAPALERALQNATQASVRVVVDLTGVTFLDSSGLAVLVGAIQSRGHEQEISPRLVGPTPMVRRVLDITGLSQMFSIHQTMAEALTS